MINEAKLNQLQQEINEITKISDKEYARCLQIYDKPESVDEYKKLLFNGVIQHFSKLALNEIKNSYMSQMYAGLARNENYGSLWFSSDYFYRNVVFQLDSAWNKIATLIKYRFTVPDGRYGSEMDRVLKSLRKNRTFRSHPIKKLVDDIRGLREYESFVSLRDAFTHSLEPGYVNYPKGNPDGTDWVKLGDKMWLIVNQIYKEHFSLSIEIPDDSIKNYKIITIIPPKLEELAIPDFFDGYDLYRHQLRNLIRMTLNVFDYVRPWIKRNIPNHYAVGIMTAVIAILNDIAFRTNDAFRSFSPLLCKANDHYSGLPQLFMAQ